MAGRSANAARLSSASSWRSGTAGLYDSRKALFQKDEICLRLRDPLGEKQPAHPLFILALLAIAPPAFCQPGTIAGTVVDASGASVAHAQIKLSLEGRGPDQETLAADSGAYSFANVEPGPFQLSVTGKGFAVKTIAGEVHAGETLNLPETALALETLTTEVKVTPTPAEMAEAQIKLEEEQRFAGLLPNYFVTYDPAAAPLKAKQKFDLTWRTLLDPSTFVITGLIAGGEQIEHTHKGFGQGAQGYAERYGTSYGDFAANLGLEKALMPILFRQDPRYFYKGKGSTGSRFVYAVSRSVVCQGDNKHAQFCYSSVIGRFASEFLTNLYYPAPDRLSTKATLGTSALGIGGRAIGNLFQEFIARKLTRRKG